MLNPIDQPVAIVTGASRGIGAATARALSAAGYAVVINYRTDEAAAKALAQTLEQTGGRCLVIQADVSDEADVKRLFATTQQTLGPPAVLVNNAGMLKPQSRLDAMDVNRVHKLLAVNVVGTLLCCQAAVRAMSTRHGGKGGAIVNVSSAAARTGSPGEYIDYACSKGAVDTLTRGLALEVAAEGIRVNGVRPGFIHTDMHAAGGEPNRIERVKAAIPMQRGGHPAEVAAAIVWLASPQASFITGSIVDVAGGV